MDLRQLTNAECGQSNPLVQLTTHVTEDRTHQDRIGGSNIWPNNNFMPPQTFRTNDLLQEINKIESREAVRYSAQPSPTWKTQYQNQLEHPFLHQTEQEHVRDENQNSCPSSVNFVGSVSHISVQLYPCYQIPLATHFYNQTPQPMNIPHQSHRLGWPLAPQSDGFSEKLKREINEPEFAEISTYNKDEYKVIESLDELVDCAENENSQEVVKEPKLAQCSRIGKMPGNVVEIIDTPTCNYVDGEKLTKKDYKSNQYMLTPLEKGKILLAKKERAKAISCFEAALKLDETCVEAWKLLGITRLDHVQNSKAIYALKQGLSLDPRNLDMLMALALCYSSHSFNGHSKYQSLSLLYSWLKYHPEYKDIIPENFEIKDIKEMDTSLKEVQDMFIKAARRRPINHDYEVQSALGILFNLSKEYNKVVDCYRSALLVRPKDARLWNRLGVILGKQHKEEEEFNTYLHALKFDPGLTCSHHNLALTFTNIRLYGLAAKHFVIALNLQSREQNDVILTDDTSDNVWSQLFRCLSLMDHRFDLLSAVVNKDLKKLNQEYM